MKNQSEYQAGTLLAGKYRVVGLLGTGGMGAVYDVLHEQIGKPRALKVLHTQDHLAIEALQRFQREMKADGEIQNAHIVEVFDAGELETGEPYVVMERLEGETLGEWIHREGCLDLDEMCDLVGQVCDGIQAAHDAGIVHRDLKPANLFVTLREGKPFVKILDFGIAKFSGALVEDLTVTHEGTLLGTPFYMSPEQIRGKIDIDGRADVYALGVILYECAAGEVPFRAESLALLGVLICEGKPKPLGELRADLPVEFRDCVASAMAVDRLRRIGSALELGKRLRRIAGEMHDDAVTLEVTVDRLGHDLMQRTAIIEARLELPAEKPLRVEAGKPAASPPPALPLRRLAFAGMMIAIATSLMTAMLVARVRVSAENDVPVAQASAASVTAQVTASATGGAAILADDAPNSSGSSSISPNSSPPPPMSMTDHKRLPPSTKPQPPDIYSGPITTPLPPTEK